MKAVVCLRYGLADTALEDVAAPEIRPRGVRISVRCAGVSFANLLVINGTHQNRWDPPFTPGTEVAGVVSEVGDGVTICKIGDRVVAGVRTGGYAQEIVVADEDVFLLPEGIDFETAVHFPTIYFTAYGALAWRAALQPGETLLVHGAAGGSGLAAIEVGKKLGARVIAVSGSKEKAAAAAAHGAEISLNYREVDFREAVLEKTDGRGADVIFDPVGGDTFASSLRCIAPEGRIIPIGFAGGSIPNIPANIVLVKNIDIIGLYWGYYMGWGRQKRPADMDRRVHDLFRILCEWTLHGDLKPRTHSIIPLENFKEALALVAGRTVIGRIALKP